MNGSAKTTAPARTEEILTRGDGRTIAYNKLSGKNPGVVFLHGFCSDMTGEKAMRVESFCRARGQAFLRFDVSGHGKSGGRFEDGTIGQWADDAIAALDALTEGPQVLVGSSMGGWMMLLTALARPKRIAGLLGLAAAPDFVEELIYAAMTEEQKREMLTKGRIVVDNGDFGDLTLTRQLIEEARSHLLLSAPINLTCPVRLIHGQKDEDVPWETALRLADCLVSEDVEVTLVKKGGHRLSEPEDLDRMVRTLDALLTKLEA